MGKIIYLEVDEEITSVIDKIKNLVESEAVLVVPKGATLLQSVINLKLLKKAANEVKKEISIVTNDRIGKTIANQVGFTVFNNIDKSGVPTGIEEPEESVIKEDLEEKDNGNPLISFRPQEEDGHKASLKGAYYSENEDTEDEATKANFQKKEISALEEPQKEAEKIHIASHRFLFSILFGIPFLAFCLAFTFIPKAEVTIKIKSEQLPIDTTFTVDKEALKVDFLGNLLPGKFIDEEREEAKEYQATGKKNVGDKASGRVTLYNEYDSDPMALMAGTSLQSTDGKVFKLLKAASIPGITIDKGIAVPGNVTVDVEATEPGDSYNIGPTNFTVLKLGIAKVYAKSIASMSGGFTKEVSIVSQEDIDKAKAEFSKEFTGRYKEETVSQNKGYTVVSEAIQINVIEASSEPAAGQETENFKMKLKLNKKGVLFKESDLKILLEKILEKEVPAEKEVYTSKIDPGKFVLTSKLGKNFSEADFKFSANVDLIPKLDTAKIRKALAFKNTGAVASELGSYQNIAGVSYKFFPFKMSKLPLMAKNITVKLEVEK